MCVYSDSLKYFSVDDLALLDTIADQVAIAVENVQLREQAQAAAVTEERHRLARDLHDSVSQTLYSQALFADLGIKLFEMGKSEQLLRTLQDLKTSAYQTLKEMRLLLYELQPTVLEKMGIVEAIKLRLESVERRAGIEAKILVDGPVSIPKILETDIHHITIEALNNSLKHSGATHIYIRFAFDNGNLDLSITDNGTGFDPDQITKGGFGLESMQQRARQIGARLTITTSPSSGTNIHLNVTLSS